MMSANGRNQSTNRRTASKKPSSSYTGEQRETLLRGLRILACMIARAHLRRQASRFSASPKPSAKDEDEA